MQESYTSKPNTGEPGASLQVSKYTFTLRGDGPSLVETSWYEWAARTSVCGGSAANAQAAPSTRVGGMATRHGREVSRNCGPRVQSERGCSLHAAVLYDKYPREQQLSARPCSSWCSHNCNAGVNSHGCVSSGGSVNTRWKHYAGSPESGASAGPFWRRHVNLLLRHDVQ